MNSKLLWGNCLLAKRTHALTCSLYEKHILLPISPSSLVSNNRFYTWLFYREINGNTPRFHANIIFDQKRNLIKGGSGYTNFGHKKPRLKLSKYGYFWRTFVFGSFLLTLFVDWEKLYTGGKDPATSYEDMKRMYGRKSSPKAKEIEDSSSEKSEDTVVETETDTDTGHETENDDADKNDEKKVKSSFRNRKVYFLNLKNFVSCFNKLKLFFN